MHAENEASEFLQHGYQEYVPNLSVDCVILGFHDGEIKVLLVKWKHTEHWSLPGGFVRRTESLDDAAHRVLRERTQLRDLYLQQFYTFGALDRNEGVVNELLEKQGLSPPDDLWLTDRVVSVGYYALVDFSRVTPVPDAFSEVCEWYDLGMKPSLLFDHDHIVARARSTLRRQLRHQPIGYNLLPEKFTMPELRQLYETILGESLDRRNFQKKMLGLGILERLDERRRGGAHRAPYLYRFDQEQYEHARREGLAFGF